MAPPCEKPASTMRLAGRPCSRINSSVSFCEARRPASSSGPPPNCRMSYHARMRMPWLMVTGRIGACGKTKRTGFASSSSGTIGSKSCPSAPRPCSQMTAVSGSGPVSIWMASMALEDTAEPGRRKPGGEDQERGGRGGEERGELGLLARERKLGRQALVDLLQLGAARRVEVFGVGELRDGLERLLVEHHVDRI